MARFTGWRYLIPIFFMIWGVIIFEWGKFSQFFEPIPFRDVFIEYADDTEINLSYLDGDCDLLSFAATTYVGRHSGQVPVYGHTELPRSDDRTDVFIDVNLVGIQFDELRLHALFDCDGDYRSRLFATLYGWSSAPAQQYHVGPIKGYGE